MHKFTIFDTKKQQGKTVDIFSTKKAQIDLSNQERNVSPFRSYKQTSTNTNLPKNQELGVSRGIFQNKKETIGNDTTPQNNRFYTSTTEPERQTGYNNYAQVFQDFLSNEFKSQIGHFRNEMIQLMNESLKEFQEKSQKNQETILAIKDSIKNHSNNIEKLDRKIEEYNSSLAEVSGLLESEMDKIKGELLERNPNFQVSKKQESGQKVQEERFDQIEYKQQEILLSFEKLKESLTENVQKTLEEYTQIFEHENDERMTKISNEITKNMEIKVEKVLDHLDGKVAVLEKQIEEHNKQDEPVAERLRFEMDDKINEHSLLFRQQIESLQRAVENRAGESTIRAQVNQPDLEENLDRTRHEVENLKADLLSVIEKVKSENGDISVKLQEFEKKLNEQTHQIKNFAQTPKTEAGDSPKQLREEYEMRLFQVERKFEEVRQDQRDLASDLSIQKAQLESFKTTTAITMNDLKANQTELEDVRLKKLEVIIDQLNKNIESVRESNSLGDSTFSTKFSDNSLHAERQIKSEKPGLNYPLTSANSYLNSENLPKVPITSTFVNYSQQKNENQIYTGSQNSQGLEKPTRYDFEDRTKKEVPVPDQTGNFNRNYLPGSISVGTGASSTNKFEDYLAQNKGRESEGASSNQFQGAGSPLKNNYVGGRDSGLSDDDFKDFEHLPGRKNVQSNNFGGQDDNYEENEDEVEVIYQIDENGFLMDEDGNHILDDKGEMMKLNEEQIERLRENNLLEENL